MKPGIIFFIILFYACKNPALPVMKESPVARADSLLRHFYKEDEPGAAIAVYQNGSLVLQNGHGLADLKNKIKISAATHFNIASLTKQFTAFSILQLAEQGRLGLEDKLIRFFPDMNPKVAEKISIKNLLTHSSGIVNHYDKTDTAGKAHIYDLDVYEAIKNTDSTYFEPGSQFRYSNTGYCLLALVVEEVAGMSFNDYLQKKLFQPAGISSSVVWNEKAIIASPATGYSPDTVSHSFQISGPLQSLFFSTEGDGGLYMNVADYVKWFRALQEGKIFSKNNIDAARSIQEPLSQQLGYGYGLFVDNSGDYKYVLHSGFNGGFRSYVFTVPEQDYLVVIFSNRDDIAPEAVVEKINAIFRPGERPMRRIEDFTS